VLPHRVSLPLLAFLLLALAGEALFLFWRAHQPSENRYDPIIARVSQDAGVDPFLVRALIRRESNFNPLTHGTADEHGLMQVTPEVGQIWAKANKIADYKDDDLYDPETNIRAGVWYLNRSLRRWNQTDDPATFALAEYNAGHSNALKWVDPSNPRDPNAFLNRITFPSTRKYVEFILEKRAQYRDSLADNRWYRPYVQANRAMTLTP
jgi:soluble lytic murein transglycosylase